MTVLEDVAARIKEQFPTARLMSAGQGGDQMIVTLDHGTYAISTPSGRPNSGPVKVTKIPMGKPTSDEEPPEGATCNNADEVIHCLRKPLSTDN